MAATHRARLVKKYGQFNTFQQLMTLVLAQNTAKIGNAVGRISKDNFTRTEKRLRRKTESRMVLPDVSEALPKRSVFVRKARERGQFLSENLRRQLSLDLRKELVDFRTATGQPAFVRRRGRLAGVSPRLRCALPPRGPLRGRDRSTVQPLSAGVGAGGDSVVSRSTSPMKMSA